jgi:hypothetical protein
MCMKIRLLKPRGATHKTDQAELMRRVGRLVLAEPEKKAILSRQVVDWALAEFGGYAAMISSEDILNAARDGIRRRLQEREWEISVELGEQPNSNRDVDKVGRRPLGGRCEEFGAQRQRRGTGRRAAAAEQEGGASTGEDQVE